MFFCVRAICKSTEPRTHRRERLYRAATPPGSRPAPHDHNGTDRALSPPDGAAPRPSPDRGEGRRVTSASISAILARVPLILVASPGPDVDVGPCLGPGCGPGRHPPQQQPASGPVQQRAGARRPLARARPTLARSRGRAPQRQAGKGLRRALPEASQRPLGDRHCRWCPRAASRQRAPV